MRKLLAITALACIALQAFAQQNPPQHQKQLQVAALPQCVDHDQTCVLHGTECCDYPQYKCQGAFMNTTCKPASE